MLHFSRPPVRTPESVPAQQTGKSNFAPLRHKKLLAGLLGLLVVACVLINVIVASAAGGDGERDTSFNAAVGEGANNAVRAVALQADGKILIGGTFHFYNNDFANGILRLNSDGERDISFNVGGTGANGTVSAVALQSDGKILIGGNFTSYNSDFAHGGIMRLNSDGKQDASFNVGGAGTSDFVEAVALQTDGKILIGGFFTSYNGDAAASNNIMRLNSDGTRDASFNVGGAGANGTVSAVALQSDGKILIGGEFTSYNFDAASGGIMRLNADGTRDTSFNAGGAGANGLVAAVALQANGRILIGGQFTSYNGDAAASDRIMRLNADGTRDTSFNAGGTGASGTVRAVTAQPGGKILIGGNFNTYNNDAGASDGIMRLNSDGTRDASFNVGGTGADSSVFEDSSVSAVALQSDGKILIGGNFNTYNNDAGASDGIMRLNSDGTRDTLFTVSGTGANSVVFAVAVQTDGKILIGGDFTAYNDDSAASDRIMRLNSDGTRDASFNPGGTGANIIVHSVAVQSDGKILIGGEFTSYNNDAAASDGIMRLNANGTRDTSFNVGGAGANGTVLAVAVQSDGKIIVGGGFSAYNGDFAASDHIMRLNSNGTRDTSFNVSGTGANAFVDAVALQTDGKILIGGLFTAYNGDAAASDFIMRLNSDGTRDTSFNAGGAGANGLVAAVALQSDGRILIGGQFTSYNSDAAASDRIMRLNSDGTRDASFNVGGAGAIATVRAVTAQPGGKILIGGEFFAYNGDATASDNIMRLNADGTRNASFNVGGTGANGFVRALALQSDGKILIGGLFTFYNDDEAASDFIMRLLSGPPNTAPAASATPNPAQTNEDTSVQFTLTGADADDDDLTFTITDPPDNGTLGSVSNPDCSAVNTCTATVTYTPAADYNGADSFKFKANDGTVDSAEVTVNITVNAVDDTSYVVTKTADTNDGACNADCSLREAITAANAEAGVETISFNIPAGPGCVGGVCTIAPTSQLPTITGAVTIDGYTQPGASANTNATGALNTVLKIELNGQNAGFASGLNITAGNTTVRGLVINRFFAGVTLSGSGATGNLITGNFIGANTAGTAALLNPVGLNITDGPTNIRVGTNGDGTNDAAERNLISGNGVGIFVNGGGTGGNVVAGNLIGTNAAGTAALANANGIVINDGAAGNRVGGSLTGEGNTIAFNTDDGIRVGDSGSTGNIVSANSIHSNGTAAQHLGIDLSGTDGVDVNIAGDADTGPNNLQNFPVLSSATRVGATTTINGTLDSNANATYRVEFFSNASCDVSGNGEGRTFLGFQNMTTDGAGAASINATLAVATPEGEFITATATDVTLFDHDNNAGTADIPRNDTSEFSGCALVVVDVTPPTVQSIVRKAGGANPVAPGSTVEFTVNFSEPVTGVDSTDFVLTTAGNINGASVTDATGSGAIYTVTVSTGTGDGAIRLDVDDDDSIKDVAQNPLGGPGTNGAGDGSFNTGETFTVQPAAQSALSVNDVTQAEGNTGATTFTFIVTLNPAAPEGGASVSYATSDGTANGGADCTAGVDYKATSGLLTFAQGDTQKPITVEACGDTAPELVETFSVILSGASNAAIADDTGMGTISNDEESVSAGQLVISEFRLRGPGASPPPANAPAKAGLASPCSGGSNATVAGGGRRKGKPRASVQTGSPLVPDTSPEANDEFIELYNATNSPLFVTTTDGSAGWAVAASDGVVRFIIPVGTVIPARAHYLGVNELGYSLGSAAGGDFVIRADDTTCFGYQLDIPDNAGIALFRTSSAANFTPASQLDAAGSTGEANTLYREGAGYPALAPATIALNLEHSFHRAQCAFVGGASCTAGGNPKDSGDNAADFLFVDTEGTPTAAGQRLGAPGPENSTSPVRRDTSGFFATLLDSTKSSSQEPNRHREFAAPSPPPNQTFGMLSIRRRVTNTTGGPVTRLRFRIVELTTHPTPGGGQADLRALTSGDVSVSMIGDPGACGLASLPCTLTVAGTTLEGPPTQPNGGGYNSTLSAGTVTLGTPLQNNAAINLQFVLGIETTGAFRFLIIVEALP